MILKNQKYVVKLSADERKELEKAKRSKSSKELTKKHAKALLLLDENDCKNLSPEQVSKRVKLHIENIYKLRKQYCTKGLDAAIKRKKRETPPIQPKITGDVEAYIIATACSEVPAGRKAWTLKMIADKVILEGVIDSISEVSIMRILKKHNLSLT
jgi:transposase